MKTKTIEMIDLEMAAILRLKSERERLEIAWGMWRSARKMVHRLVRSENPNWPTEVVEREVARRLASGD